MSYDKEYYENFQPLFGSYIIDEKLGAGSYGTVFKIVKKDGYGTYYSAMKAITIPKSDDELQEKISEGMEENDAKAYFEDIVKGIVTEFKLMDKLKGNSNIVCYEDHSVYEHTDSIGWDILIRMELLTDLQSYIRKTPMNTLNIVKLGIDMCNALELCSKHNIIHRDIKPENIFINENGDFKLGDFGIARQVEKTQVGLTRIGTPSYMAPEVYNGIDYDASIDIYSLGIVLYKLLNHNRIPFLPPHPQKYTYADMETALKKRLDGNSLPAPAACSEYPALSKIVLKACEYYPGSRFASPTEMKRELIRFYNSILPGSYSEISKVPAKELPVKVSEKEKTPEIPQNPEIPEKPDVPANSGYTLSPENSSPRTPSGPSRIKSSGKQKINFDAIDNYDNLTHKYENLTPASGLKFRSEPPSSPKASADGKAGSPESEKEKKPNKNALKRIKGDLLKGKGKEKKKRR